MLGQERHDALLRWLSEEGRIHAASAAKRLDVSLDTVRRDLSELEAAGACRRVHGGALPPASPGPAAFALREEDGGEAKARIATAAAALVGDGDVIALHGGTTTLAFARALPAALRATVVTTSPDVALALSAFERLRVDLVGGRLDPVSRTVTGSVAIDALRRVRPAACFLGACSLHPAEGLSFRDRDEAAVVEMMLARSGQLVALLTADKLGTAGPYPVAPAERVDVLVTDARGKAVSPYRKLGTKVVPA